MPVVAIGSGGKSGDEDSFREAVDAGGRLAQLAARYAVTLALKPHVGAAVYNTETALRAWREIGSPHLGLNFDPSHLHRADEDVVSAARAFAGAGALVHSHFRDCPSRTERGPGTPEQQIPGRGEVDIMGAAAGPRRGRLPGPARPGSDRRQGLSPLPGHGGRRRDPGLPQPLPQPASGPCLPGSRDPELGRHGAQLGPVPAAHRHPRRRPLLLPLPLQAPGQGRPVPGAREGLQGAHRPLVLVQLPAQVVRVDEARGDR